MTITSIIFSALGLVIGTPIGTAFSPLAEKNSPPDGVPLSDALDRARIRTRTNFVARIREFFGGNKSTGTAPSTESPYIWMAVCGAGALWLVYIYAIHATKLATFLVMVSCAVTIATMITFGILYWRHVANGRNQAISLLMLLLFSLGGITSAIWTVNPPFNQVLDEFLAKIDTTDLKLSAAIKAFLQDSSSSFPVLTLQMLGVAMSYFAVLYGLSLCAACISSTYMYLDVKGAKVIWTPVFWLCRWTTAKRSIVAASCVLIAALLFVSGAAYSGFTWFAEVLPKLMS